MRESMGEPPELEPSPPSRLFERLAQLPGYTWDQSFTPYHSSYDNWHVFGVQHRAHGSSAGSSIHDLGRPDSIKNSPGLSSIRPALRDYDKSNDTINDFPTSKTGSERTYVHVAARISTHVLRLEREHHLNLSYVQTSDPDCNHTVRLIDLLRLPSHHGDELIVSIFESPAPSYLRDLLEFEQLWVPRIGQSGLPHTLFEKLAEDEYVDQDFQDQTSLPIFLDFAVGACECLELLHHGLRAVHGEIRGDAFYFNKNTSTVKIINFGSGPRSFQNGLTSVGWSALSREAGIIRKLQFIAPEQTGRMPAEPDSRTDIYSLGILFWTMLTRRWAFDGDTPLDVIQSVLSRRIPAVSTYRIDIPDVISEVIRKMTLKQIDERYHSISGLKHDLFQIQEMFGNGGSENLANFKIGSKDVSSFFVLPTNVFGRAFEYEQILKVIDKVSRRLHRKSNVGNSSAGTQAMHSTSASTVSDNQLNMLNGSSKLTSTISDGRLDVLENDVRFSETSSQAAKERNLAIPHVSSFGPEMLSLQCDFPSNPDTIISPSKLLSSVSGGRDTVEFGTNLEYQSSGPQKNQYNGQQTASGSFAKSRGNANFKRSRCEVITIAGAAGLGKSSLIQSVQANIRRCGYFASAKFDSARKAPFEHLLAAMSALFRQIFSESENDYHAFIRGNVGSFWPTLSSVLNLPDNLISLDAQTTFDVESDTSQLSQKKFLRAELNESSSLSGGRNKSSRNHLTTNLVRGSANNPRSLKIMGIFIEVLRVLSAKRLICLCLDDLHFADEESLDVISNIMSRKLGIVLVITFRGDQMLSRSIAAMLDSGKANITSLNLAPLNEQEITEYVAATLYRSHDYAIPLAIVCLERTNGNPFYLKQMLETCHRKGCLWYSWKLLAWEYDIDRVLTEFETDYAGQQLNTAFITRRLQDLPSTARTILAWASLLGSTFSFTLVQRLLSGEFDYVEDSQHSAEPNCSYHFTSRPTDHVEGLQAALQSYILMPGNDENEFSFSHDRYMQASERLRECADVQKMHFIIALTMMKYTNLNDGSLYVLAEHICKAATVIKRRIQGDRRRFRELLTQAAEKAMNAGARPTAVKYYETCLDLLQSNAWNEGSQDVSYDETLNVHTRVAELYWFQGQYAQAQNVLAPIFDCAKTAADKAPAWILQSKIQAAQGNLAATFDSLKASLTELGLNLDTKPNLETCDRDFKDLQFRLEQTDHSALVDRPFCSDSKTPLIGAVFTEAISAAYWSDALLFYQMVIKMVDFHRGNTTIFDQSALGFGYLASIGVTRFGDLSFAKRLYNVSHELLGRAKNHHSIGRGLAISFVFIAHLFTPIHEHYKVLEEAMDHSLACGDKHVYLFSIGSLASCRLFLGADMSEIESYCNIAAEDFGNWAGDIRGGVLLTASRQVARSLQGKTWSSSADTVMSDEHHSTIEYLHFLESHSSNVERQLLFYKSLLIIPLYLFGHYRQAMRIGSDLLQTMHESWSIRNSRLTIFYLSLSIAAWIRENPIEVDRDELLERVKNYKAQIDMWQGECDVNYLMWSLMVQGEIDELTGDYHEAIQAYEAAIDHTEVHGFILEQALAFELQAGFFVRRGAKRAARASLLDAIATYARINAVGKAEQVKTLNEWILKSVNTVRTVDSGVQTDNVDNTHFHIEENERRETRNLGKETAGDRTEAWVEPGFQNNGIDKTQICLSDPDIAGMGLDVLDLQSILSFNQLLSSELQIDRLLAQMTEIILESAGTQADFAGVVIEGEGGWCIAAGGTAGNIGSEAVPLSEIKDETQKQVLLYAMRFKEAVFVHNVANDDRFCNTPSTRAVIALPIVRASDLLGVLYLEGQPNSFTDRNFSVLHLLCNQVGISIANALLFRQIRKVSASNSSMVDSQRRALAIARDAEAKAKLAEAEAMRNVRLKEEAAQAKSMFLANVSHELRTPLNGVIGMSDLLKASHLNQDQESYADSIRVCADTLLTVINDILDFSKLEAGKMKLLSVPLNLKETIKEVVRALSYTYLKRGLETIVDLHIDPNLRVMGDPVRLHQIFMNLLSNSYKFTEKGSVTVRAKIDHQDEREARVTCSVEDTGIGISQEQITRLFKPFSQADSSTQRTHGGSGLGLSICKALLVDVLKGKIWLESQLGIGTTVSFSMTFPKVAESAASSDGEILVKDPDPDPMATWSSDADGTSSPSSTALFHDLRQIPRDQIRICIAEDNPINQKIAVSYVTRLGLQCEAFNDGLQAVEALRRESVGNQPFHIVLMDVQMPVLDGYDATRLIRRDEDPAVRGVIIIALTASAIRGDREKCLQAGMSNYLAKPIRATVLKSMIEEYLTQPPPRDEPDHLEHGAILSKMVTRSSGKDKT